MRMRITAVVALTLIVAAVGLDSQERRGRWWVNAETQRELALTADQSSRIDALYQASLPRLRELKDELDKLEGGLSELIRENRADESVVAARVDEVERVRGELSKTRTLMLYRMHRMLSPEQHEKLRALFARWERERRKSDERPR